MKKTIHIKFTESDWQKAKRFASVTNCIIATAVRRVLRTKAMISCDPWVVYVYRKKGVQIYRSETYMGSDFVGSLQDATQPPFYTPSIIGKTLTLTLVESMSRLRHRS